MKGRRNQGKGRDNPSMASKAKQSNPGMLESI